MTQPSSAQLTTTDAVSARMSRQATRNTRPERALRSLLHARGLRYRVHLKPEKHIRREADIVFTKARVAVFVDGCFWHGCPEHGEVPKSNDSFWRDKLEGNRIRDTQTRALLEAAGWSVVRVWEHEPFEEAADRVETAVKRRTTPDIPQP